jgi:Na+-driven multidrug efflux pump
VSAGFRIDMVVMLVIYALSTVLIAFVGQNWGAGSSGRVRRAWEMSAVFSVVWGLLLAGALRPLAGPVAGIFSDEAPVLRALITYVHVMPWGYGLLGVCVVMTAVLNAVDRPVHAFALNTVRLVALFMPLSWMGARFLGLHGLFAGATLANVAAGVLAFAFAGLIPRGGSPLVADSAATGAD